MMIFNLLRLSWSLRRIDLTTEQKKGASITRDETM